MACKQLWERQMHIQKIQMERSMQKEIAKAMVSSGHEWSCVFYQRHNMSDAQQGIQQCCSSDAQQCCSSDAQQCCSSDGHQCCSSDASNVVLL